MTASNERGTALVATLILALLLLPVGAFVAFQARTDWQLEHNLHWETEAFYVADAGIEHAIADIGPLPSFDALLNGPDHIAGTSDDGVFPFTEGAPAALVPSPLRYDVHVERVANGLIRLSSQTSGSQQAGKVVEALVAPAPLPFTPAALHAGPDVGSLDLGDSGFLLSGLDHRIADAPESATGTSAALPAVAAAAADGESALRRQLDGEAASRVVGAGGTASIATVPLDVQTYATGFASAAGAVRLSAGAHSDDVILGSAGAPQISVVAGDLTIGGHLSGNGILVVQGTLQVTGQMTFTGLVVTAGALLFDPSSDVLVRGTLWRSAAQDARMLLLGRGAIVYSSAALAVIDAAFPGVLPHQPTVVGWQEPL